MSVPVMTMEIHSSTCRIQSYKYYYLYQHPRRFYHLALLCRWRAGDMHQLRQVYCKDGTCKPNERKHMMVVILLLHLNCFAQYALCGLNLGYRRPQRPVIGVALTISVAISAPAVAGLYNNLSPLGKDYEAQPEADDEESQLQRKTPETERRYSLVPHDKAMASPLATHRSGSVGCSRICGRICRWHTCRCSAAAACSAGT